MNIPMTSTGQMDVLESELREPPTYAFGGIAA